MKRVIWIFLFLPLLFSCDEDKYSASEEASVRPLSIEEKYLVNASNDLALKVLSDLQQQQEGDVVFSPLGLGMASGILSNSVEDVNQQLLGLQELKPIEVNKAFYEMETMLPNIDKNVQLNFANALWNKPDITLSEDLTTRIMAYYNADVRSMNFEKESSEHYINKWIEVKTNNQFQKLRQFDTQNDFFLLNAATFSYPYLSNTDVVEVNTSVSMPNVFAYENESLSLKEYLLGDNTFSLITITPKANVELAGMVQKLSVQSINRYREAVELAKEDRLPKLNFEFEHNYAEVFNKTWLNHFMVKQSLQNLEKGNLNFNITHKAAVNISFAGGIPDGVEATTANISTPYLFFIAEPHTELLLFAGIVR